MSARIPLIAEVARAPTERPLRLIDARDELGAASS